MTVIADTGFWLALANRKDAYHAKARSALVGLREPLISTWPVVTETCHLLAAQLGVESELMFIDAAHRGAFAIFDLAPSHLSRVRELMEKYRELPMDLADASLVIVAEHIGSGRILSTDQRDFGPYRWKNRKPFRNLLTL
ncbi:MAG TPA: PIN domain-containing protein [Polyangiaceae bacterium]